MAQAALTQEDFRVLEQLRQRVSQLNSNIASLKSDVLRSNPLPPWNSLQTSVSILSSNIETLTTLMSKNADLLNKTIVYPSTNYPGRTQEGTLTQLLRKKLELPVETCVDEARKSRTSVAVTPNNEKDDDELLEFARDWIGPRIVTYVRKHRGDYTFEERARGIENVNTGLRRNLLEDESEDSDEDEAEDEDIEDAGVAVTTVRRTSLGEVEFGLSEVKKVDPNARMRNIEDILRFATTGISLEGPRR